MRINQPAKKLLGTTNIIKTIYLFIRWIFIPQECIELAKKLISKAKEKHDYTNAHNTSIAIGYLNEFYSKYIFLGKTDEEILKINEQIDSRKRSTNKLINFLSELRKLRSEIKKITNNLGQKKDVDQVLKTDRTFGVSSGTVSGSILNISSNKQIIPKNTIGVFPTSGTKYTNQFLKCSGIIFLNGSITAHGAIIAREFKIPAIVSSHANFKDGTRIILNGKSGFIKIIDITN